MANILPLEKQEQILRGLGMETPLSHLAHILDVAPDTVARYARLAGDMAIAFLDAQQRDLEVARVEVDEYYSYCGAKRENVDRMKNRKEGDGEVLHFLAVVPGTGGFILSHLAAPSNDLHSTQPFIRDLGERLKRDENGDFIVRPTIVSDGHGSYKPAIEAEWGTAMTYLRLNKQRSNQTADGKKTRWRFIGVSREVVVGELEGEEEFWTNNVESVNRTARARNRRVARRTNTFSKTFENHKRQFAYWVFYHNYCLIPKRRDETPAMKVRASERLVETKDIIKLIHRYHRRIEEEGLVDDARDETDVDDGVNDDEIVPFWLYRNFNLNTVKVHRSDCCNCRNGKGRNGQSGRSGEWHPIRTTLQDALDCAQRLEPKRVDVCRMCIGEYQTLGRRI